jgi:hypothetical protein
MTYEQVKQVRDETRGTGADMKRRQAIFGITYKQAIENLDILIDLLNKHIAEYNIKMRDKKARYWVSVNEPKIRKAKPFTYVEITGKGTYFNAREVITFCDSGFIGFCGEADSDNEKPILTAFGEWVNIIGKTNEVKAEDANA